MQITFYAKELSRLVVEAGHSFLGLVRHDLASNIAIVLVMNRVEVEV